MPGSVIANERPKIQAPIRTYTVGEVCTWLEITPKYISELVGAGVLKEARNDDGDLIKSRFFLKDTVRAYIKYVRAENKSRAPSLDEIEAIKIEKGRLDIEAKILENEVNKGTLVKVEHVNGEVIDMLLALRSKLMGFSAHVSRLILGKEDFEEVTKILQNEMEKAMIDLKPLDFDAIRARDRATWKKTQGFSTMSLGTGGEGEREGGNGDQFDTYQNQPNGGEIMRDERGIEKRPRGRPRKEPL